MIRGRDPNCQRPLPPGTMGLPFLGETLQLVLQVRHGPFSVPKCVKSENSGI